MSARGTSYSIVLNSKSTIVPSSTIPIPSNKSKSPVILITKSKSETMLEISKLTFSVNTNFSDTFTLSIHNDAFTDPPTKTESTSS